MKLMPKTIIFCAGIIFSLFLAGSVSAKTDLSISETDITFSKDGAMAGETIRIYTRVFNVGDVDALGYVTFFDNDKEISDPQPISVKTNTYDDVFIDWKTTSGTHNIKASITGLNSTDDDNENNSSVKKDIFVDIDTDKDGTGDSKDTDDDNDEVLDEDEIKIGINPLVADSDSDGVNDKVDAFGKDVTEWRDTDTDGLGDNKDPDIDGDGVINEEETKLGTNPHVAENPPDTANPFVASLLNSNTYVYWAIGVPFGLIILYFLFRRKRRRR